ncbi:phage tail tube protein [Xanthobacter autotrophicus]|uniref:phage tail tube protein n=1 Tax=Xanthobacter autotrophicus TaxID=280 RepID=UPI00372C424D
MADDCCNSFGGKIVIQIGDTRFPPTEADITIDPTNMEVEAMVNQDASAARIVHPRLYGAEFTLRNTCGLVWSAVVAKCRMNVTIVEEDNGRQHLFTGAFIVGRPKLNLTNGEVSGLSIASASYKAISA